MSEQRVLSVRIPLTTLASCYLILQEGGTNVQGMAMSAVVRNALVALETLAFEQGLIQPLSDDEAFETLRNFSAPQAGFTAHKQHRQQAGTRPLIQRGPGYGPNGPDSGAEDAARREASREMMEPRIQEVRDQIEKQRWARFSGGAQPRAAEEEVEAPPVVEKPPWLGVTLADVGEVERAASVSPITQRILREQDQLGLLAVRYVLAMVPDGVLGSPKFEELVGSVASKYTAYAEAHPDTEIPLS